MTPIDLQEIAAKMGWAVLDACPVCDHSDYTPVLRGRGDCVLCSCQECHVVFLNPRPARTTAASSSGFAPGHAAEKYLPRMVEGGFLAPDFTPNLPKLYGRYRKLVDMAVMLAPTDPILDIGCGIGLSMLALGHKNIDSKGIDVDEEFIDVACKTFGLDVANHDVHAGPMRHPTKAASLNAVLEHIDRPVEFLDSIRTNILSPSAALIVTVPNLASLEFLRHGGNWNVISGGHVWYPTERTLAMVAERAGFTVEHVYKDLDRTPRDKLDHFYVRSVLESQANLTGGIGMILRSAG